MGPETNYSRRQFLRSMGLAAGFAAAPKILRGKEQQRHEQNDQKEVTVTPEYERTLETVLIAVPTHNETTKLVNWEREKTLKFMYGDFFRSLPPYTKIELLVRKDERSDAEMLCEAFGLQDRVAIYEIDVPGEDEMVELWTQDFGESVRMNGEDVFLIPKATNKRAQDRKQNLAASAYSEKVREADFYFEGGNMTFDRRKDGELRVCIGYNDIEKNPESPDQTVQLMHKTFPNAEVIVLGGEPQGHFFHIDQYFVLLGNNIAVMNKFDLPTCAEGKASGQIPSNTDCDDNDIRVQENIHKQLTELGYDVRVITGNSDDFLARHTSANAVPFFDKTEQKKKIFFPVYPSEVQGDFYENEKISAEDLVGKGQQAYEVYSAAGYEPIPVRDLASARLQGGLHCMTNVIR